MEIIKKVFYRLVAAIGGLDNYLRLGEDTKGS
jgi:hypothetical protein